MSEKELTDKYVLGTYSREDVAFVRAKGSYLWSDKGEKYLDFFPGWGIGNIGHVHPSVKKAVCDQAGQILHMPNNFYSSHQGKLAGKIVERAFPGRVFFSNSGAEANECALKVARAYGNLKGKPGVVTARKSFHGRTMATITLTGQEKYQKGFGPLLANVEYFDFNSISSFDEVFHDSICAVMIEVIQGEGGVQVGTQEFIRHIRQKTQEKEALLIIDEVQTGVGRTGTFFAYENYGIVPDIVTMAKALGGGVPIGATIVGEKFADILKPGMHASTFGGNSLACRAALAVLEVIEIKKILEKMPVKSRFLFKRLKQFKKKFPFIKEVRGMGLMAGIELEGDKALRFFKKAIDKHLIVNCTAGCVLRILPALNISRKDLKAGLDIMEEIFYEIG
ncbi:MAG: aspartate aminotransferase family protein [Candidatus Aureabacteria bacterium]|nr:aspartate aminotransferase family protein [Candidatus Auribacterota bacterium]